MPAGEGLSLPLDVDEAVGCPKATRTAAVIGPKVVSTWLHKRAEKRGLAKRRWFVFNSTGRQGIAFGQGVIHVSYFDRPAGICKGEIRGHYEFKGGADNLSDETDFELRPVANPDVDSLIVGGRRSYYLRADSKTEYCMWRALLTGTSALHVQGAGSAGPGVEEEDEDPYSDFAQSDLTVVSTPLSFSNLGYVSNSSAVNVVNASLTVAGMLHLHDPHLDRKIFTDPCMNAGQRLASIDVDSVAFVPLSPDPALLALGTCSENMAWRTFELRPALNTTSFVKKENVMRFSALTAEAFDMWRDNLSSGCFSYVHITFASPAESVVPSDAEKAPSASWSFMRRRTASMKQKPSPQHDYWLMVLDNDGCVRYYKAAEPPAKAPPDNVLRKACSSLARIGLDPSGVLKVANYRLSAYVEAGETTVPYAFELMPRATEHSQPSIQVRCSCEEHFEMWKEHLRHAATTGVARRRSSLAMHGKRKSSCSMQDLETLETPRVTNLTTSAAFDSKSSKLMGLDLATMGPLDCVREDDEELYTQRTLKVFNVDSTISPRTSSLAWMDSSVSQRSSVASSLWSSIRDRREDTALEGVWLSSFLKTTVSSVAARSSSASMVSPDDRPSSASASPPRTMSVSSRSRHSLRTFSMADGFASILTKILDRIDSLKPSDSRGLCCAAACWASPSDTSAGNSPMVEGHVFIDRASWWITAAQRCSQTNFRWLNSAVQLQAQEETSAWLIGEAGGSESQFVESLRVAITYLNFAAANVRPSLTSANYTMRVPATILRQALIDATDDTLFLSDIEACAVVCTLTGCCSGSIVFDEPVLAQALNAVSNTLAEMRWPHLRMTVGGASQNSAEIHLSEYISSSLQLGGTPLLQTARIHACIHRWEVYKWEVEAVVCTGADFQKVLALISDACCSEPNGSIAASIIDLLIYHAFAVVKDHASLYQTAMRPGTEEASLCVRSHKLSAASLKVAIDNYKAEQGCHSAGGDADEAETKVIALLKFCTRVSCAGGDSKTLEKLLCFVCSHDGMIFAIGGDDELLHDAKLAAFLRLLSKPVAHMPGIVTSCTLQAFELMLFSCERDSQLAIKIIAGLKDDASSDVAEREVVAGGDHDDSPDFLARLGSIERAGDLSFLTTIVSAYLPISSERCTPRLVSFMVAILMVEIGVVHKTVYALLASAAQRNPEAVYPYLTRLMKHSDSVSSFTPIGDGMLSPLLFAVSRISTNHAVECIALMTRVIKRDVSHDFSVMETVKLMREVAARNGGDMQVDLSALRGRYTERQEAAVIIQSVFRRYCVLKAMSRLREQGLVGRLKGSKTGLIEANKEHAASSPHLEETKTSSEKEELRAQLDAAMQALEAAHTQTHTLELQLQAAHGAAKASQRAGHDQSVSDKAVASSLQIARRKSSLVMLEAAAALQETMDAATDLQGSAAEMAKAAQVKMTADSLADLLIGNNRGESCLIASCPSSPPQQEYRWLRKVSFATALHFPDGPPPELLDDGASDIWGI